MASNPALVPTRMPTGPGTYPDRTTYPGGPVYKSPGSAQEENPEYHPNTNPEPTPAAPEPASNPDDEAAWAKWQERLYNTRQGLNEDGSPKGGGSTQKPAAPSGPAAPAGPPQSAYPWWADPAKNPNPEMELPKFEAPNAGLDLGLTNQIDSFLSDIISGKSKRFSPEQLQMMKDEVFTTTEGGRKKAVDQANADAVSRGLFRSGIPIDAQMNAQNDASTAYSKGVTDINLTSASAEFDDKMKSIGMAQQSLDARRQYLLQLDKNSMDRTIGESQIRLEQAKINAAKAQLDRDMSSKYDINKSNEQLQRDLAEKQSQTQLELANRTAELQKWLLLNTPKTGGGGGGAAPKTVFDLPPLGPVPLFQ
jgi:hypothetical protein